MTTSASESAKHARAAALALACLLPGAACWDVDWDTAVRESGVADGRGDDGHTTAGDSGLDGTPSVTVAWGASSVRIDIAGGPGEYWFGMAEVGDQCGAYCWTGEDCAWGYEDPESGDGIGPYCHFLGDLGGELLYGGNCSDLAPGTTCFPVSSEGTVAYLLLSDASGDCWVGGAEEGVYFAELGCALLSGF